MTFSLTQALHGLSHDADWVGVRHYREQTAFRMARNGALSRNTTQTQDGIMANRKFKPPVQADPCSRNRADGESEPTVDGLRPANLATRKPRRGMMSEMGR